MRLPVLKSLLSVLVLLVALPTAGQAKDIAQTVDEYLTARTDLGRFSGAVLIGKDGKVLLRKGYGFADVEKRLPYTPETQQDVASISKMFTAMAALKLREQGKLRLDDPVCKYLEDCPETWKPITLQQLMRHTSGIPDYEEALEIGSDKYMAFMNQPGTSAKIVENAKKLPLDFKPGEKFHYSNTGYILLSYAVQKAAGQPFGVLVARTLLAPAGMVHSGVFGVGDGPKNLATGYTHGDLGWDKMLGGVSLTAGHLKKVPQLPLTPPEGDAGIYSTVDDLYRWSQVMEGGALVSVEEAAEVFTPGLENYGYGWFIDNGFDRPRMRHTGLLPGYVSDFIKFPGDKVTIILTSNLDRTRLDRVARDVTAIVLGKPYDLPVHGKVVQLTAEQFAKLEGDYKMTDGKLLAVRKKPDLLTAEIKGRYLAGLIPLSPTELYFPLGDGKAVFTLDESGKAVKVNMRYGGEDHVGERVAPQP
ncbi:MAG TPA: serine hydrolase domain-containing protein [Thermoanaerobaculia bacterium]|jgi:CubicO group peptidase (beta-lactamase class C family)|nr:serine hydrolase domain-containing protein [Thermoanaerobaculia bacterium]